MLCNSKKNNFNKKKVERHLKYIDKKTEEYLHALDGADKAEDQIDGQGVAEEREELQQRLETMKQRREKYKALEKQLETLEKVGETQISLIDEDARALPEHMNIVNVGYNVLTATQAEHSLIAAYEVTNKKDDQALWSIACSTKEFLGIEKMTVLADKGFCSGKQLKLCDDNKIITLVAPKTNTSKKDPNFTKDKFVYNEQTDCYICPVGERLSTKGTWYEKNKNKPRKNIKFQRYEAPLAVCRVCEHRDKCGPFSRGHGRYIERTEYDEYVEANKKRVHQNKELYRKRQQIVEHPYGTIKRSR